METTNETWQTQLLGETLIITEESMLEEGFPVFSHPNIPTMYHLQLAHHLQSKHHTKTLTNLGQESGDEGFTVTHLVPHGQSVVDLTSPSDGQQLVAELISQDLRKISKMSMTYTTTTHIIRLGNGDEGLLPALHPLQL